MRGRICTALLGGLISLSVAVPAYATAVTVGETGMAAEATASAETDAKLLAADLPADDPTAAQVSLAQGASPSTLGTDDGPAVAEGSGAGEGDALKTPDEGGADDPAATDGDGDTVITNLDNPSSDEPPTPPTTEEQLDALARESAGVVADGEYLIRSDLGSGRVLDVRNGSHDDGGNVQTYDPNMTGAQRWVVTHDDKGYVILTNKGSGKALDVSGGTPKSGTNVQQYRSNGTRAQRWIVQSEGGSYRIISALSPTLADLLALDVQGGSTATCANVQVYTWNGTKAQLFSLFATQHDVAPSTIEAVDDGAYYAIASSLGGSQMVDVAGGSHAAGANVQVYAKNGTPAQLFRLRSEGSGYYRIECAGTGKVLAVKDGCPIPGTNVLQVAMGSDRSQLFSVRANQDGTVSFVNVASGLVLDVAGGRVASGTNLQGYSANGTKAQSFALAKVADLLPSGLFELAPSYATGKRLDVSGGSTAGGANVQIWDANGSLAQKWNLILTAAGSNAYRLQGLCSGRYLTASGGNVVQGDASEYGVWVPSFLSGGLVLTNAKTGLVLDVSAAGSANGTNVQTYQANQTAAQRFLLLSTSPLPTGCYVVRFVANAGQVLDVAAGSEDDCANVQSYAFNDSGAQKWYLECRGGDVYALKNAQSNRYLDVSGGVGANGRNVWQYQANGSAAQGWRLVYTGGAGTFRLVSLTGDVVLSTEGVASTSNGRNVVVASNVNSSSQQFTFSPTTYDPTPASQNSLQNWANRYSSSTDRLILVDTGASRVYVFYGRQGSWKYDRTMVCSAGKPSTPTVKGQFTVQNRGYSFGHGYTCYYWTQFYGDYLFHSVLYYQGTRRIKDGTLGRNASHGCVRLAIENAKWIYDCIPRGTKVVVS